MASAAAASLPSGGGGGGSGTDPRDLVAETYWPLAQSVHDAALETAQRIQGADPQNIESLRLIIFYLLSCEGNLDTARKKMSELTDALDRHEPRNAQLYTTCARDIARLSGGHNGVLGACSQMLERARRLQCWAAQCIHSRVCGRRRDGGGMAHP